MPLDRNKSMTGQQVAKDLYLPYWLLTYVSKHAECWRLGTTLVCDSKVTEWHKSVWTVWGK